jgi:hypothetical protein
MTTVLVMKVVEATSQSAAPQPNSLVGGMQLTAGRCPRSSNSGTAPHVTWGYINGTQQLDVLCSAKKAT